MLTRLRLSRPRSALRQFLRSEAAGGIVLMAAALLALIAANSPVAADYFALLQMRVGPLTALHWINDGAMALFFFVVGLEIKREWLDGHLSSWADRRLPILAAAAGMVAPALMYLVVTRGNPMLAPGWAIPAATDIAFAIGVLALLGKRAPASLKLFLTTVAIVDDIGAVAIIALAYTQAISGWALLAVATVMAGLLGLNGAGVVRARWYVVGFALLWLAVLASGVHATIAGVLAALAVPLKNTPGTPDDADSTLHRVQHALHPWVAFAIVPLFGFANAGISFAGIGPAQVFAPLPLGIALGLFVGKQAGVFGAVWLAVKLGFAARPARASWRQIYGVALLCGIGFTMSLFIGGLAFTDPLLADKVKIGVLMGSLLSAVAGYAVLRFSPEASPSVPARA